MKLNFTQIMGARLCICQDMKIFSSKVCIKLQCNRICFSGSKLYSLKVENIQITWNVIFLYSKIYQVLSYIYVGLLAIQTLYITNVFFFLIEQYFIDTLESWHTLKLFQSVRNDLSKYTLYSKNIFYHVYTFWTGLLDNNCGH